MLSLVYGVLICGCWYSVEKIGANKKTKKEEERKKKKKKKKKGRASRYCFLTSIRK